MDNHQRIYWPKQAVSACSVCFAFGNYPGGAETLAEFASARYETGAALERLLAMLRRFGLRQTFFIPLALLEGAPEVVDRILLDNHELALLAGSETGWDTASGFSQALEQACTILQRLSGSAPAGFRGCSDRMEPAMISALVRQGFRYDSSVSCDDQPFYLTVSTIGADTVAAEPVDAGLYELPVQLDVQIDAPVISRSGNECGSDRLAADVFPSTLHSGHTNILLQVGTAGGEQTGRALDTWIEQTLKFQSVWFAPLADIVDHLDRGGGSCVPTARW